MRLRSLLLVFALLLNVLLAVPATAAESGARIVRSTTLSDRLVELAVRSDALGGKEVGVRVLLPAGYREQPGRRWPTLFLLHGCCEGETGYRSWTVNVDGAAATAGAQALIVMPEGGAAGFYSNWLGDGPAWERFHLGELKRLLEKEFRANQRRAVAGLSMGGFGALSYAARHPGFFSYAAAYSGVVHTRYQGSRGTDLVQRILTERGFDKNALWGDPVAQERIWRAHNPFDLAARLRHTPVYLASGDGRPGPLDPPGSTNDWVEELLGEQTVSLANELRRNGVRLSTDLYGAGRHNWPYWERALKHSLPMLLRSIGA
ncbi:alpha/beta hydrolase [Crossiella cryophila]|uniref:S-formylglutathione hydrolase FrmB n=1 Tax=Crossiella cryophila TaxID=43355 RepID=A0A7W7CCK4_9PSEU|nr:alpha/beta hydrolase family protein [Crossiella cryophila]MBB4677403.1 S-formylglutathione hydrolase FrmB [Crossiella cryophila]